MCHLFVFVMKTKGVFSWTVTQRALSSLSVVSWPISTLIQLIATKTVPPLISQIAPFLIMTKELAVTELVAAMVIPTGNDD